MTLTERFQAFVCEGDSITCEVAGFEITARIVRDDCGDAPDERQDGFWPSLYKDSAGFIGAGPNHRARFDAAQARAEAIMEAWRKDEWFYCGIVLSIAREGIVLDAHAASLLGIEANYPDSANSHLDSVANELLPEALDTGRAAIQRLCTAVTTDEARA
ncbi:hypothetical protein [Hyphomonas sp. GM-8P]|uniref:hypothetical protein n=1 Tax=Hyphomonas sp. GM-8P TaxID=1280945 RepID=UPI000DBF9A86|nr:hypothetical protein [Hyphomonas sp. GM-8P]RAN37781.1 hypothetical protein HY26_18485 [Hyphomonas sp. GM-8P]|tara:strand:- start:3618 stop:4094 length:477 start_codon:yes stop_codon:yes gene_type:complete